MNIESESDSDHRVASKWGYVALLRRYPSLRLLWYGRMVSLTGDWFNTIAIYEAVQRLTSSALAVTLVIVAKTLPMFVIMPVAGPLVDRFDRRALLILSDLARALCAGGLIAAHLFDWLPGIYAAIVALVLGTGVAFPTSQAALPMIVPSRRIPMANALMGGTWSIMLAVGAALGGAATAWLGVTSSFAINAATFLIAAVIHSRLPPLPAPAASVSEVLTDAIAETAGRTGFRDGLRYLLSSRYILALAFLKPMMQIYGGLISLLPLYGTRVFASADGPLFVGLLYAARGVGATIGSLVLRAVFGDRVPNLRRIVLGAYVLGGVSYAGLAFSTTYWHAILAYFLSAIGQSAIWTFSGSLIQIEADHRFHGRVFSFETGVAMLFMAASSYVAGVILDAGVPIGHTVLGFAALTLFPITLWGAVVVRRRPPPPGLRNGETSGYPP